MKASVIAGLLKKYYYITVNRLDRIFDIFYWPLVGLFIWGFTTYFLRDIAGEAIIYIFLGGTVLWIFFQRAAQDISVYILEDFWSDNLYNLFAAPIKTAELVISIVTFGAIRSLMSFLFLVLMAIVMYSFNVFDAGIIAVALFSLNLLLFGWVIGLFVSSFIFRYGMRIQVIAWSIPFLIQPFSAVYYPLDSLPIWVQKISLVFPTTYVFEGMRYAFAKGAILWDYLAWSFGLNIALLIFVCLLFGQSINYARKKGLFVKRE